MGLSDKARRVLDDIEGFASFDLGPDTGARVQWAVDLVRRLARALDEVAASTDPESVRDRILADINTSAEGFGE